MESMDRVKRECGLGKERVDCAKREFGLGKGRVWTG